MNDTDPAAVTPPLLPESPTYEVEPRLKVA